MIISFIIIAKEKISMKKLFAALCLSVFMFGAAHAEEIYDPQHTMLAKTESYLSRNTRTSSIISVWEISRAIRT